MSSGFTSRLFTPWKGGLQGAVSALDPAYGLTGKTVLNPVSFAGKNSWLAKESEYDPLLGSSYGKYVNPEAYNAGQERKAYFAANTGQAGPYAGVTPTLDAASTNYSPVAAPSTAPSAAPSTTDTAAAARAVQATPPAAGAPAVSTQPSVWSQAIRQAAQNRGSQSQYGGIY